MRPECILHPYCPSSGWGDCEFGVRLNYEVRLHHQTNKQKQTGEGMHWGGGGRLWARLRDKSTQELNPIYQKSKGRSGTESSRNEFRIGI